MVTVQLLYLALQGIIVWEAVVLLLNLHALLDTTVLLEQALQLSISAQLVTTVLVGPLHPPFVLQDTIVWQAVPMLLNTLVQ